MKGRYSLSISVSAENCPFSGEKARKCRFRRQPAPVLRKVRKGSGRRGRFTVRRRRGRLIAQVPDRLQQLVPGKGLLEESPLPETGPVGGVAGDEKRLQG